MKCFRKDSFSDYVSFEAFPVDYRIVREFAQHLVLYKIFFFFRSGGRGGVDSDIRKHCTKVGCQYSLVTASTQFMKITYFELVVPTFQCFHSR